MTRDNLIAFVIFIITIVCFFTWGINTIPNSKYFIFFIASLFGIFMAFNIGGNDVANSFGTSVGAKTLTIKQALIIAAIFELSGAVFAGAEVTNTIRNGIINFSDKNVIPEKFVAIMMSALLSSGLWLFFASRKGLPVSTTHSIVGGIVGAGIMMGYTSYGAKEAFEMVTWSEIGKIAISWVISPLMGGVLSFLVFGYIKKNIINPTRQLRISIKTLKKERKIFKRNFIKELKTKPESEQIKTLSNMILIDEDDTKSTKYSEYRSQIKAMKEREKQIDSFAAMKKHIPLIAGFAAMVISSMMIFKGLKNINLDISIIQSIWILFVIGVLAYLASFAFIKVMNKNDAEKSINRVFSWFQIFTASSFAFSHGANDIANAIGPFVAILDVLKTGVINKASTIPSVVMITFGISLVVGLWFLGKEVISTIGSKLAEILPTTGFSAELGASMVILLATKFGIPVSSTHILIGAVLGIGIINKNANWAMVKPILLAWVITLPASAILSGAFYFSVLKFL
ncbi:inorganic phosphate transporter [Campylobacter pinnipediorum]|uniref:inorganic phosphate transporter n=1 Tax=Campylobacter pinnipediorum TaxID=1965231 RepID=UPI00099531C4|nr:inorganic phosphate transporter [Campylobacter pinnipediorum]AQW81555.1 inorganic phosphate transporter, PitA family [Campylobacter pinnipediorum subsp. pinnipediorum]AQW83183.1 inorganic phosphate transporter, PitA family [Campylobacter pinnipediorum subsp. pinnipediorum]